MILYIFKSILCLAVLLLVYLVFLEKEKMHRFNRWYLLGSIVFACLVPLVSFEVKGQSLPILQDNYFEVITTGNSAATSPAVPIKENTNYLIPALLIIYGLITSLLLIRFITNIYRLLSRAATNKVIMYRGARLILLKEKIASHSFLNNIFISEEDYADHSIEEELITHELTHVREKHSWDVMFIELLQTIFWFNPLFLFYKKAIQLNHEYLADDAVIKTYENVPAYQYLLLEKASCNNQTYLTSNFNFSVTKKRLVMMTRTTNRARAILKKLAVLPLLACALFLFSSKIAVALGIPQDKPVTKHQGTPMAHPAYLSPQDKKMPFTKEGISTQLMDEFNSIVNKYVYVNEKGLRNFKKGAITTTERNRLETIFKQMSREQQASTKIGFTKRMDPWAKITATDEQFEKWKDETKYGVWIDGKKVKNEELNKYKASDFSHYFASNLAYTEKMKKDVMKSFNLKVMYKVQLDLMTHAGYADYYNSIMTGPEIEMYFRVRDSSSGKVSNWRWQVN
jgi:bla regulator protein BlaR1